MYITLLKLISFCGLETWALRKTEEQNMPVFEAKVFRKMYRAHFNP